MVSNSDDGYTEVTNKRKAKPAASPPPQQRASVTVAPHPPTHSSYAAFRVPAQPGFESSYDAVASLEDSITDLKTKNVIGKDGSSVLIPLDAASFKILDNLATDTDSAIRLIKLEPQTQTTKGVLMGFPLRMPLSIILRHPQVEEAQRCQNRMQEETRQVIVTLRGPLVPSLTLGNWGTFYLRPYSPEPLRCFKCHKFGHHQANCIRDAVCGICSEAHDTQQCLTKYKAKEAVNHRCPNCKGTHHAWNKACPTRQAHVERGRERQMAWVAKQQEATSSPAPPGTFVWGTQRRAQTAPTTSAPPPLTQAEFPLLQATHEPPLQPSAPHRQPTTPTAQPTAPATHASSEPTFTATDLKIIGKELAMGVAQLLSQALGVTFDVAKLDKAMDSVIDQVITKTVTAKRDANTSCIAQTPPKQDRQQPATPRKPKQAATALPRPPGLTPATARIERERKMLNLPSSHAQKSMRPKTLKS